MRETSSRARRVLLLVVLALAALAGPRPLAAQGTTGKIEGIVRESGGAPLAGAQVFIVGSAFTTVTNEQGYYFFNSVPTGYVTVRAQYVGYAPSEVRNARVFADQTLTVNVAMEVRAIEIGGITIREEENPIVPRDQVTTKPIIQGELVDELPVDRIEQMLVLQPGVVTGRGGLGGLSIRGGRPGEAITYIDGAPVRSNSADIATILPFGIWQAVGTNAMEQASITTGASGAEYGDHQSGVISYVTRSGGSRFRGTLGFETDEPAGDVYGHGLSRLQASVSGPLFRRTTFFLATTLQGVQSPVRGKGAEDYPVYVLAGVDTTVRVPQTPGSSPTDSFDVALPAFQRYSDGARLPDAWSSSDQWDAKLQTTYGVGSRLSLTYHRTRSQGLVWRGFANLYNPMQQRGDWMLGEALTLNWAHNLARTSDRALLLNIVASWQRDQEVFTFVDQAWFNAHRTPFAGFVFDDMRFLLDLESFPIDDALIQNIRLGDCRTGRDAARPDLGGCTAFVDRRDFDLRGPYRANPYGITAGSAYYSTSGFNGSALLIRENRLVLRGDLDWQVGRYNRVRVGAEGTKSFVDNYAGGLTGTSPFAFREQPVRFGTYVTDRLDLGDVVVDVGLRADLLDTGILYPRANVTYRDPIRTGDLSTAYTAEDTAMAVRCEQTLAAADSAAWSTCNYYRAPAEWGLSPSIRVAFPVTDRTGFRLSYAHQIQAPEFDMLMDRPLTFGRTILFEVGLRHAFSDRLVLDIAGYDKEKLSDPSLRSTYSWNVVLLDYSILSLLTNADWGNAKGVDVKLDTRIGSLFQGSLSYSFVTASGTGSDPWDWFSVAPTVGDIFGVQAPFAEAWLRSMDTRTHTFAGSLALSLPHGWRAGSLPGTLLQDVGVYSTFRFASGLAYTRCRNDGSGTRGPGNGCNVYLEPRLSSTMPWYRNVDLRLTKGFRLGGQRDVTLYADVRNLLNFSNMNSISAETATLINPLYEEKVLAPHREILQNEAGELWITRAVSVPGQGISYEQGVDLNDCQLYQRFASYGVPNCLMLRGAEERFGDGDRFFSVAEQNRAFREDVNVRQGPQSYLGTGRYMRFGIEFSF